MELQFVFGNPRKAGKKKPVGQAKARPRTPGLKLSAQETADLKKLGGALKKPLPKKKGGGKLKEGCNSKKRSHQMAKRKKAKHPAKKRKVAKRTSRKNPTMYYAQTGENKKTGKKTYKPIGLPIPTGKEYKELVSTVKAGKLALKKTGKSVSVGDLKKAVALGDALGIDTSAAKKKLRSKSLNNLDLAEIMSEIKEEGLASRVKNLEKYLRDIKTHKGNIRGAIKRHAGDNTLNAHNFSVTSVEGDDVLDADLVEKGLPGSFYDSLSKFYANRKANPMKRRKHKKAKNPVIGLSGVESYQESNPKKTKKKKAVKKTAHKKAHKKTKRHSKKSKALATFIMSKPLAKRVRKMKKGKTLKPKSGVTIRRNPMLPSIPALRKFLGLDLQPMAMLAVAAASTGVVNGLVRFGLNKTGMGSKLGGTVARNLVPSVGPMMLAVALNMLGDKMRKPVLRELGEAFATVGIVSLGVNTLGGAVTRGMSMIPGMKTALSGYDSSIGLLPEGMSGYGEDDADFGEDDADFGGDGSIGADNADFGAVSAFEGVSAFDGVPEGMSGVSAYDGIPEGMGEDDADFGEDDADFGEGDAIG